MQILVPVDHHQLLQYHRITTFALPLQDEWDWDWENGNQKQQQTGGGGRSKPAASSKQQPHGSNGGGGGAAEQLPSPPPAVHPPRPQLDPSAELLLRMSSPVAGQRLLFVSKEGAEVVRRALLLHRWGWRPPRLGCGLLEVLGRTPGGWHCVW